MCMRMRIVSAVCALVGHTNAGCSGMGLHLGTDSLRMQEVLGAIAQVSLVRRRPGLYSIP